MSTGTHHIPDPEQPKRAYCGAPIRKPVMDRPQECPQCKRVRKRRNDR